MRQLSALCRNLRQPLEAGLTLLQAARLLAKKRRGLEPALGAHLEEHLQQGQSLGDTLDTFTPRLPRLFLSMTRVGEETGRLPETLRNLEDHYQLEERMLGQLRRRVILMLFQMGVAVLVLALVIGITTTISPRGGLRLLGLSGWGGALGFIGLSVGLVVALILAFQMLRRGVQHYRFLSELAHKVPGLGPFLEALLVSRFALALKLTLDSSLPAPRALILSFQATADATFQRKGKKAAEAVRRGSDLSEAIAHTDLLPPMFLEVLSVAEVVGVVPERMGQMAQEYHEEAVRRARGLVRVVGLLLWGLYAVAVILAIFRLASMYLNALGG